jgi:hypothetical protein
MKFVEFSLSVKVIAAVSPILRATLSLVIVTMGATVSTTMFLLSARLFGVAGSVSTSELPAASSSVPPARSTTVRSAEFSPLAIVYTPAAVVVPLVVSVTIAPVSSVMSKVLPAAIGSDSVALIRTCLLAL